MLAGAASLTALATGYLIYGYTTEWKGSAYSFWCPKRKIKTLRSPFFAQVDQESETLSVDARAWMERYVNTKIKKTKKKSSSGNSQEFAGLAAEADSERRSRQRTDSLVREGTGRYAEELGDCIATEKGLLKREGFQHI